MNIIGVQYTLKYRALEIYIAGCKADPHCEGCHNPESWSFDAGEVYDEHYSMKIRQTVTEYDRLIDNIMIFGGEPNDSESEELKDLLVSLKSLNKSIWLFTRYEIQDVMPFELELCDYIKCGRYEENNLSAGNIQHGIKLASKNQRIYKKGIDY